MSRARRAATVLALAALALGTVETVKGALPPVKAWMGQRLLATAWAETMATGRPAKPWGWADARAAAHLSAPRIGAAAVVLDAASGEAMAWGPGHVAGTAPLGQPGLAAVAGHRDSHLAFLADLAPGDRLVLTTADGTARPYRVTHALVVDARVWRLPARRTGPRELALATCWPFGSGEDGPLRFVLFAEELAAA